MAPIIGLHPEFVNKLMLAIAFAAEENPPLRVGIFMGLRNWQQQDALYALGRTVKNVDGACPDKPMGNIVTHARGGESWHNYGLAADVVFQVNYPSDASAPEGVFHWDWADSHPWQRLGELGEEQGLEWGGRWLPPKNDKPHFEMRAGLALKDAQGLYSQGGLPAVWAEIDKRLKGGA